MPRFYFHVWTDGDCAPDPEGVECANEGAAQADAMRAAHDLLQEDIRSGRYAVTHRIVIEDETGTTVTSVPFSMSITGLR